MNDWLFVAPLLILGLGSILMMLVDAFAKEKSELAILSSITMGVAGMISASALLSGAEAADAPEMVTRFLAVDPAALFFDVVICFGGALSALLAGGYLREHGLERGEFYVLLTLTTLGAVVLGRSTDMLSLFVGLETMSLGVYAMVAFRRGSSTAIEGAVKYFLLGSFAAAILLFGSALMYAATGSTSFTGIAAAMGDADPKLVLIGLLLIIAGFGFKVSAVPFHMWTPDAYEGAITPATAFMSVAVKSAAFAVFVRILFVTFGDELSMSLASGWPPVLAGLAALTMVYGNIAAVGQENVKRMLAYSSIAHAGYILVGIVAAFRVGSEAVSAVLFYLLAYTFSNILAFGSLILLGSRGREAVSFNDLRGVGRRHPMAALPFILGTLSLMGFPPTAGFLAKYYVFSAAVQAGGSMILLAILGMLTSAIGAFYYLRVTVFMFMRDPEPGQVKAIPMKSGYVVGALAISSLFVLGLGVMPGDVLEAASRAASLLLG